jgi:hypothetical protein
VAASELAEILDMDRLCQFVLRGDRCLGSLDGELTMLGFWISDSRVEGQGDLKSRRWQLYKCTVDQGYVFWFLGISDPFETSYLISFPIHEPFSKLEINCVRVMKRRVPSGIFGALSKQDEKLRRSAAVEITKSFLPL